MNDGPGGQGFNLLDEPWIRVLALDGHEHEASILEVFANAPRLSVIGGEVSTQAFAITRLLLSLTTLRTSIACGMSVDVPSSATCLRISLWESLAPPQPEATNAAIKTS